MTEDLTPSVPLSVDGEGEVGGALKGLSIRAADANDAADVADVAMLLSELNAAVGAVGMPDEVSREPRFAHVSPEAMAHRLRLVEGVETVLVASIDAEPAGFVSLRVIPYLDQDTPYAEVTQMHTRPQYRRRGVAAALIEAAETLALAAGATCVHIITGEDNTDAQAFYRAQGYDLACYEFEKHFTETPERQPAHA